LRNYFGKRSYEFTIEQGLHTINPVTNKPFLNRYIYNPIFVELTDKETQKYNKLTQQIIVMRRDEDHDPDELQKLYERRANIGKNAENKKIALSIRALLPVEEPVVEEAPAVEAEDAEPTSYTDEVVNTIGDAVEAPATEE